MAYNISVGDSEIRVAYIAIVIYIVFAITALIIVWTCFKEKAGIGRLKEVVIGDNYDAAAFNADVNIDMNANNNHGAPKMLMEMDLAKRLNWKRSKTELEMANLEPERMKSKDIANFNEYDEDMFSNIDLANNPLSNDSNNMIQQLKIGKSVNNVNNSDAIHRSPSYQGNAIRLEELSNYDLDEVKSEINGHSYASTVHTLAINSQMKPRVGHHHNGESQQVLISMQNNHSINIQSSPSVSNKKNEVRVIVPEEDEIDNCCTKMKDSTCGICFKRLFDLLNKSSLYTPILFHFWDMATDLAVLCDWIPDINWNDPQSGQSPSNPDLPNTFYFFIASICAMLLYRTVSAYRYAKRFNTCGGILQFFDIMLFFEIYASVNSKQGKSTLQLRWIRKMESVLESAPQAFVQLVYALTLNDASDLSWIVQASLLLSICSITSSVVRSDEWKIKEETHANKMCPPHWRFVVRAIFRLFEITTRLCIMALLSQINVINGLYFVMLILGLQIIFYLVMYKDGFLGNDLGNIIEILIVHPNLSLRVSEEEMKVKTESTFGWLFRTLLCWTPIAGIIICFKNVFDKNFENIKHKSPSICNMCIHSNLVTVHFTHRCIESFLELSIFVIAYYFDPSHGEIDTLFNRDSFTRTMFIVAIIGTIFTPFLYLISYRWYITGKEGLEMTVFGFLHHAHSEDDITQFVRFIYRVRSSVNEKNKFNRTPLMEGVLLKNYDICKVLCSVTDYIDLSITDSDDIPIDNANVKIDEIHGKQIIHYAAEVGDARIMKLILDAQKQQYDNFFSQNSDKLKVNKHNIKQMHVDAVYGKQEKNALIICSEMGHADCGKLLLEYGANPDYQDTLGRTALHYAIFGQSAAKVIQDANRFKLLIKSVLNYSPNLTLYDNKRKWTALFQAVGGGSMDIVDLLINIGLAPLDTIDHKGESLLHVAVRYNRFNVLNYLLTSTNNKRWNLLHKNNNNETPLKLSIMHKYITCMRILINVGKMDRKELMKGLLVAVKMNHIEVVKVLLREFSIDPNFTDKDEMTPLRWAAFKGYKLIMKELLIGGARDDPDQFGQNIVFYAAKNDHLHILELLKKANADFCTVNFEGQTATDKTNNKDTIKFIQSVRNIQLQQQYH